MMKTKQLKNLDIIIPKGLTGSLVDTPPDLPALHGVFIFCGRRGSGKSYAAMSLLKHYMDADSLHRIFVISPTIHSNKPLLDLVHVAEEDHYDEPSRGALEDVIDKVQAEATDYEAFKTKMELYKKYERYIKTGRGLKVEDHDDLLDLFDGENIVPPVHRYGGKRPGLCLVIDDCQGSDLFNPKAKLMNRVIRHRHLGKFSADFAERFKEAPALGLTIVICIQSYKSSGGGLGRSIRGNCTGLAIFKTKSDDELKEIYEEAAGEVGEETFAACYESAVQEDHGFLFIDFNRKKEHPSMFRSKFNKFLIPSEVEADAQKTKCVDTVKEDVGAGDSGKSRKHRSQRTRSKRNRRGNKAEDEVDG